MQDIFYENSAGVKLDLLKPPYQLQTADIFDYGWDYISGSSERSAGTITGFKKAIAIKTATLGVLGNNKEAYYAAINHFHNTTEYDVLNLKPGKLWFGAYYFPCYIIGSQKTAWEDDIEVLDNTITILSDLPKWINEQLIEIKPISSTNDTSEESNVKKYPYSYPYTYPLLQTQVNENINHYTESDFQMKIYGPALSVNIKIEGHPYIVEYPVEEGEYMVIDSRSYIPREERLYIVKSNGEKENIFNYRSVEYSVFKKIPAGNITIDYPRTYGVDLTIFKERSEPLWNSSL